MPLKSKRQHRWMRANKPRMAKRWEKNYGGSKGLPEKASGRGGLREAMADERKRQQKAKAGRKGASKRRR